MIKPTIGRVVYFFADFDQPEPFPALITYVHSDVLINVAGFDHNGNPFKATSVTLEQPEDETAETTSRRATWMPYQVKVSEQPTPHRGLTR